MTLSGIERDMTVGTLIDNAHLYVTISVCPWKEMYHTQLYERKFCNKILISCPKSCILRGEADPAFLINGGPIL
jgi:hypothetical protein